MSSYVHDWVAQHGSRRPDAPAVTSVERSVTLTWGELDRRIGILTHLLRNDFGLQPDDRVALIAENDTRLFEVQFACLRAGLIFVPMNWRLAIGELIALARDAGPRMILFDDNWAALAGLLADAVGSRAHPLVG